MIAKMGQASIWIILSIVIVAIIGFLFFINYSPSRFGGGNIESLELKNYIDSCVAEKAEEIADEMLIHGGFIEPKNYKIYNNVSIEYLCRNTGFFKPCINQHASYISETEDEITRYLSPKVEKCFENLDSQLEKKNVKLRKDDPTTKVLFAPGKILIEIERNISIEYKGQKYDYSDFSSEIQYPIYSLLTTARVAVNDEAKYCYFEYVGYMVLHPELKITKKALADSTKIYEIEDVKTKKELIFSVRGCAIPPGI